MSDRVITQTAPMPPAPPAVGSGPGTFPVEAAAPSPVAPAVPTSAPAIRITIAQAAAGAAVVPPVESPVPRAAGTTPVVDPTTPVAIPQVPQAAQQAAMQAAQTHPEASEPSQTAQTATPDADAAKTGGKRPKRPTPEHLKPYLFKPGNPGGGRPRGSVSIVTRIKKLLQEGVDGKDLLEALARAGIKNAAAGKFAYWKEIIDRIDGPVPKRIEGAGPGGAIVVNIMAAVPGRPVPPVVSHDDDDRPAMELPPPMLGGAGEQMGANDEGVNDECNDD